MSDAEALAERLEQAAQPGMKPVHRRRIMLEAAAFIRSQLSRETANDRTDP